MKTPTLRAVPLLCLIGFFTGLLQVQREQLHQQERPPPRMGKGLPGQARRHSLPSLPDSHFLLLRFSGLPNT